MGGIEIKEVQNKKELKEFIKFPLTLYKDNSYFVPPILTDEIKNFDKNENPAFEFCKVKCFLAYKDGKIVGRVAGIINSTDETLFSDKKLRFGWFDFIEDKQVADKLIHALKSYAQENGIRKLEGPVGFTNLDKAGMLTEGFEEIATLIGLYNHSYYPIFLEEMGFKEHLHWIESKILFPDFFPEKLKKAAELIQKRYELTLISFLDKKKSDLLAYADKILDLLEETYKTLPSFVPFTEKQKAYYKKKYFSVLSKDLILVIEDKKGELIAFSIVMPDYSKALQKAGGKLFPWGWYHLLTASKNNPSAHFYLIGVKPEYQSKGVPAMILYEMYQIFLKKGIKYLETNPQLIDNKAIQLLFKDYNPIRHKERKTYVLEF